MTIINSLDGLTIPKNQKNLEQITGDSNTWTPNLDIVLPIDGSDIRGFKEWVNWSGWKGYSEHHTAYDFAAYLNDEGNCVLGLHQDTPVRAVADGVVRQISNGFGGEYACFMNIEHGSKGSGMFSAYHHVAPLVKDGQEVRKGEVIATLHKDEGDEEGKLVHLHFELANGWNHGSRIKRAVNPELIYSKLANYKAEPQGSPDFQILGLQKQPEIYIANFKKLLVDNRS